MSGAANSRLRVGFLHLGAPHHGVTRYGRLLARTVSERSDCAVVEAAVDPATVPHALAAAVGTAVRSLSDCDVIHVQFNRALFGEGWNQPRVAEALFAAAAAPVVVDLHDVYLEDPWRDWRRQRPSLRRRLDRVHHFLSQTWPTRRTIAQIVARAAASIVCFECERSRLAGLRGRERIRVVGHFVEARPALPDRESARRALDIGDRRLLTVLGYIHRRKGHDLVVDALPHLPADTLIAFVGQATPEHRGELAALQRRAREIVGDDRFRVTGFVDEPTLERWLVATDVALCPFRFFSASGSLATWLSAARPIVCHDLPQIAEYRRIAPDAFTTFDRYEPEALARAVQLAFERTGPGPDVGSARLRDEFSLERVTAAHVAIYREVVTATSGA